MTDDHVDGICEFGERVAGAKYVLRPGGYAVIVREPRQIAVIATARGGFLPGGGLEQDETPAMAAIRETREECGLEIRIVRQIGVADELVFAADEATHFRKRCTFFVAELIGPACAGGEEAHLLTWVSPRAAAACLLHESQRWAVTEGCSLSK
jgi:8-oxo-dGTP diphosphatase